MVRRNPPWSVRSTVLCALVLVTAAGASIARADDALTVMVFQGVQNLPLYAAQQKGFFAKHGLAVDLRIAPGSQELRDGLAQGRYQIVHTAVDNAVAMAAQAKIDIAVVMGGDNGWNELFVRPDIRTYADLRSRTVVVDAPDTAYAFQLYQMLKLNGVDKSEVVVKPVGATRLRLQAITSDTAVAATVLNMPFSLQAEQAGMRRLATAVDVVGPYLATTGFVLRSWGLEHRDTVVRYIQAYIEGLRWALQPANSAEAVAMLTTGLGIPRDMAVLCYAAATDRDSGFAVDARIDMAGFRNVLKLRAELHGDWGGIPPDPATYVDLSYYERALDGLR